MSNQPNFPRPNVLHPDGRTRRPAAMLLGLAASFSLMLMACTTAETDEAADGSTAQPAPEDGGSDRSDGTEHSETDGGPATGSDGEPSSGVQVVLTDDEGISEEPADEPTVGESEPVEIEFEDAADADQAKVGVSESALCATLQIGRDAAVDGDAELAAAQRDLLIERMPRLEDERLAVILAELNPDEPLDVSVAEDGLDRCETLGFEI